MHFRDQRAAASLRGFLKSGPSVHANSARTTGLTKQPFAPYGIERSARARSLCCGSSSIEPSRSSTFVSRPIILATASSLLFHGLRDRFSMSSCRDRARLAGAKLIGIAPLSTMPSSLPPRFQAHRSVLRPHRNATGLPPRCRAPCDVVWHGDLAFAGHCRFAEIVSACLTLIAPPIAPYLYRGKVRST